MGDIADMMLEGSMCEQCGEYLGEGDGYPRLCGSCSGKPGNSGLYMRDEPVNPKVPCEKCGRRVTQGGMKDHMRAKHGIERGTKT